MFRDDTPRPPSSAGAPRYLAVCAGYATELEYPRAVRLIGAIAFDRAPLTRYPKPANLGEDVKGNEETREQGAHMGGQLFCVAEGRRIFVTRDAAGDSPFQGSSSSDRFCCRWL
jgi:hypothetical protein